MDWVSYCLAEGIFKRCVSNLVLPELHLLVWVHKSVTLSLSDRSRCCSEDVGFSIHSNRLVSFCCLVGAQKNAVTVTVNTSIYKYRLYTYVLYLYWGCQMLVLILCLVAVQQSTWDNTNLKLVCSARKYTEYYQHRSTKGSIQTETSEGLGFILEWTTFYSAMFWSQTFTDNTSIWVKTQHRFCICQLVSLLFVLMTKIGATTSLHSLIFIDLSPVRLSVCSHWVISTNST